jgi:hypothetical protein
MPESTQDAESVVWISDTLYRVTLADNPLELGPGEEIVRCSYNSPDFHVYIRTGALTDGDAT